MKERPLLFSTAMVQAIIAGRKTQTRRIMKSQPADFEGQIFEPYFGSLQTNFIQQVPTRINPDGEQFYEVCEVFKSPYGGPGDVLWVREKWKPRYVKGGLDGFKSQYPTAQPWFYAANGVSEIGYGGWKPSIHMPKDTCRIYLQNSDVRVQRLQEISSEDAIGEGIESMTVNEDGELVTKYRDYTGTDGWFHDPVESFKSLWFSINGADSWKENP